MESFVSLVGKVSLVAVVVAVALHERAAANAKDLVYSVIFVTQTCPE